MTERAGPKAGMVEAGGFDPPRGRDSAGAHGDLIIPGGEMAAAVRAFDWARTPLGPTSTWPQSLRTTANVVLASRHPMCLAWGPQLIQIYNDAFRPVIGRRHPQALGQPARVTFADMWPRLAGLVEEVLERGGSTWLEDAKVSLDRHGYLEECYFTYGYSPIVDERGRVAGLLVICTETTVNVIGYRRLRTVRNLAAIRTEGRTVAQACRTAAQLLAENPHDVPFALLYLCSDDRSEARLAEAVGLEPGGAASPLRVSLDDAEAAWPLGTVVRSGMAQLLEDPAERLGALPGGPWREPARRALALPMASPSQDALGVLVVGVSPRRPLDEGYRSFFDFVVGHIASAITTIRTYEQERRTRALADMAGELQRSLLPEALPTRTDVGVAVRYLAGASGTQVGGDWYDVFELPGGRLGVSIGDVMGRGIHAAVVMGQLRTALRGYGLEGHSPSEALRRLDRFVRALDESQLATCMYGTYEPGSRSLCFSVAGHLPPLLAQPGLRPRFLEVAPGLPLGVGGEFSDQTVVVPPGSLLLLYTDGLVEERGQPIEEGLERLRAAVAGARGTVEELCDAVLVAMGRHGEHDDDTALLAISCLG